jgi:hypothetical protein
VNYKGEIFAISAEIINASPFYYLLVDDPESVSFRYKKGYNISIAKRENGFKEHF